MFVRLFMSLLSRLSVTGRTRKATQHEHPLRTSTAARW
jgi:hypothetical protein